MKQRLFLIIAFVIGLTVAIPYAGDFLHDNARSFSITSTRPTAIVAGLIVLAIVLQLAGHLLRAHKSRYLLDPIRQADTPTLFRGLSIGYLFNTLLPLRLGEVVRAFYLGDKLAISKTAAFVSIIIERIVDSAVLGLAMISAGLVVHGTSGEAAATIINFGLGVLLITSLLAVLLWLMQSENRLLLRSIYHLTSIFNNRICDRLRFIAWSGIYGARLMLSGQAYRKRYLLLSAAMWLLYFASTACIALVFFNLFNLGQIWFVTQSTYVGVSAPAGPGYIGSFHLILSDLLQYLRATNIYDFAVFIWLIIITPISLVGLYVLLVERQSGKSRSKRQDSLINKLHRGIDVSSEFSHFLSAYFQGEEINQILSHAELDNKFKLIKSFRGGSNAHTILAWQDQEICVKKITLIQYADKLSDQAQWLRDRSHLPHLPRVVNEETTSNYYYFDIAYQEAYAPFFEFIHSNKSTTNNRILGNVVTFMRKSIYQSQLPADHAKDLAKYIDSKILGKVQDAGSMNSQLNSLLDAKKIRINGKSYLNLISAIEKLKATPAAMADLAYYAETPIHGDLTIDNLIVSNDADFLVLDPNNENQVSTPAVDYGKLYQSLHSGYEFLIQLERCNVTATSVTFEDSKSHKYAELYDFLDHKLHDELPEAEYRSILFHEAVHYCRMLTYRANINPETLPAFYATATKLFNEFLEQYK